MSQTPENTPKPDRTAEFVRLLKQHDRRLSAYVHSLVPDWNEAEDIVQDTSVRLWEQFDKYDSDSNFCSCYRQGGVSITHRAGAYEAIDGVSNC